MRVLCQGRGTDPSELTHGQEQLAGCRVCVGGCRVRGFSAKAEGPTQGNYVSDHVAPRQEREPPPRRGGVRAPRRLERGGTTERATRSVGTALQAAAPQERRDGDRPQRGRERADSHAQRVRAVDHATQAESSSRRSDGAAAERHAAESAATRPSGRQGAGAVGCGAARTARWRSPKRGRDRADSHAQRARAADHVTPCRELESSPRRSGGRSSLRRERSGMTKRASRSARAVPQAAALRERRDGDRPQRGRDRADSHAQRARAADHVTKQETATTEILYFVFSRKPS